MKLNYKRTLLVGLAFLSICAFWQLYDNVVPLILKNTFDIPDDIAGVIMALDNVLALFLLPLFGKLSDRTHTRLGRRMPYILGGTLAAVLLMNLLPVADRVRSLGLFVAALGLLLLAMGVYRSPAVALMPDVTPKPLRSKGNAIINLMGTLGGVFTLAATSLLVTRDTSGRENYTALFLAVSVLMLAAVVALLLTIRENRLAHEVELQNLAAQGEDAARAQDDEAPLLRRGFFLAGPRPPPQPDFDPVLRRPVVHGLQRRYHRLYQVRERPVGLRHQGRLPVPDGGYRGRGGELSARGLSVLSLRPQARHSGGRSAAGGLLWHGGAVCQFQPRAVRDLRAGGRAWAMINVNSYPMVVEISKSGDVGKYTGYYYTFSMAAQIVTPIVSGWLLEHVGYYTLLPYAAVMVALSFVTISLTRHGDSRPQPPRSKLEAFDAGDD